MDTRSLQTALVEKELHHKLRKEERRNCTLLCIEDRNVVITANLNISYAPNK